MWKGTAGGGESVCVYVCILFVQVLKQKKQKSCYYQLIIKIYEKWQLKMQLKYETKFKTSISFAE